MNNMERFGQMIDYIETHLDEPINGETLSRMLGLSVYEFRRVFSFIAGIPLGEYLRKRRLSVAAKELSLHKIKVTEAAARWGYDSPSSFSRAFKEFHGCSPQEATNHSIRMFSKISLVSGIAGGKVFSYQLMHLPAFCVSGIQGVSDETDTECCEQVWQRFYAEENGLIEKGDGYLYAVYQNHQDCVDCLIGIKGIENTCPSSVTVPESLWACFQVQGTNDEEINRIYTEILEEWAESGNIKPRRQLPNVERFPALMDQDPIHWEILIPVEEIEA